MRSVMIAAVVGLVTVAAAAPTAADPVTAATNAMAEADFDKALALLDAALTRTRKPLEIAKLQLMRGDALVALQRLDEATRAFSAALAANPLAELDPNSSSPDAMAAMEKARRQIMSDLTVLIAGGASANVKIDEVEMGPAPLKTRVGAGKHRVEALASSGQRVTKEIDVAPGKPMQLSLELPALEAPLPPPPPPPAQATPATAPPGVRTTSSGSKLGFIPVAVGAGLVGAGVGCLVMASGRHQQLVDPLGPRLDGNTEARLVNEGSAFQTIGFAVIGVGAAAAVAGTAMLFLMPGSVHVTAAASPSGGFVGLAGTFEETGVSLGFR
ncbi:MAG: hypothetical protein H6Q89_5165 [Myxococcaceae bacterium]|nr:hypothetical protein [Myxococcaceae bacterium]